METRAIVAAFMLSEGDNGLAVARQSLQKVCGANYDAAAWENLLQRVHSTIGPQFNLTVDEIFELSQADEDDEDREGGGGTHQQRMYEWRGLRRGWF
jgi:hypothetical protein